MKFNKAKRAMVIRYYVHAKGLNVAGRIVNDGVLMTTAKWDRPVPKFSIKEMNTPAVKKVVMKKLSLNGDVRFISAIEYGIRWFYNHFFTNGFSLMWEQHDE